MSVPAEGLVSITPLLRELLPPVPSQAPGVSADAIANAVSLIFDNKLSSVQTAILLYNLHTTGLEQRPDVLAACARAMRAAAIPTSTDKLRELVQQRNQRRNAYAGGLCDIVGTGGDYHSTFNISTASSIIVSAYLVIGKHGNRASTSKSGSADVLAALQLRDRMRLDVVGPKMLEDIYSQTNYAFLFAPNFHPGLRHIASLRKELPCPTIFNLLGPLAHPAYSNMEAQVIGVKRKDLVPVFAEALRIGGADKAMVVCGDEDLDEVSCAGPTHCARLTREDAGAPVSIEYFTLTPEDFGLPRHALSTVSPGLTPEANAAILHRLLCNEMAEDDPILHFVLLNAASLLVISGMCKDSNGKNELGPGKGQWKSGVRLAREALRSGKSLGMLQTFARITSNAP